MPPAEKNLRPASIAANGTVSVLPRWHVAAQASIASSTKLPPLKGFGVDSLLEPMLTEAERDKMREGINRKVAVRVDMRSSDDVFYVIEAGFDTLTKVAEKVEILLKAIAGIAQSLPKKEDANVDAQAAADSAVVVIKAITANAGTIKELIGAVTHHKDGSLVTSEELGDLSPTDLYTLLRAALFVNVEVGGMSDFRPRPAIESKPAAVPAKLEEEEGVAE